VVPPTVVEVVSAKHPLLPLLQSLALVTSMFTLSK
jgi:hypothetical protein